MATNITKNFINLLSAALACGAVCAYKIGRPIVCATNTPDCGRDSSAHKNTVDMLDGALIVSITKM